MHRHALIVICVYVYSSFLYKMKVAGNYAMHILTFSLSMNSGLIRDSSYIVQCALLLRSYY